MKMDKSKIDEQLEKNFAKHATTKLSQGSRNALNYYLKQRSDKGAQDLDRVGKFKH
ncbi:MAG: hypothetical protein GXO35_08220 [Gammaproteobacteria bacterium]|nr:hypothetical protein [Gammaproteobacteria bacterium]